MEGGKPCPVVGIVGLHGNLKVSGKPDHAVPTWLDRPLLPMRIGVCAVGGKTVQSGSVVVDGRQVVVMGHGELSSLRRWSSTSPLKGDGGQTW